MTNDNQPIAPTSYPRLKVIYLLGVTLGVFVIPPVLRSVWPGAGWLTFAVVGLVLCVQAGLLLANRVSVGGILGTCSRLKWLFVFLVLCATFLRNLGEGRQLPRNPLGTAISGVQGVKDNAVDPQKARPQDPDRGQRRATKSDLWIVANLPATPQWRVNVNLTGLQASVLMCLQIATVILVSSLVRVSGTGRDLVDGLRGLRFPQLFCYSIDNTLALIGGVKPRGGGRKARGSGSDSGRGTGTGTEATEHLSDQTSFFATLGRLLRGDLAFFLEAIRSSQVRSQRRISETMGPAVDARLAHDAAVISGIGVMLMTMKMFKVLPGISFASGYKTLLYIPLYLLASRLTYSRWGATTAGSIMGVIGLMMGDGRTGVFEVLKHVAPGVVIDLLDPLFSRLSRRKVVYLVLGFIASAARTLADLSLVLIPALSAGNFRQNPEILMFPLAKLIPNVFFGTLGGVVAYYVVGAFAQPAAEPPGAIRDEGSLSALSDVVGASAGPETEANDASLSRTQG
jgi:energy-coupling factor transporter transmembrane protein EcfT